MGYVPTFPTNMNTVFIEYLHSQHITKICTCMMCIAGMKKGCLTLCICPVNVM